MATPEGEEAIDALRGVMAFVHVTDAGILRMSDEITRLRSQLQDCEMSLKIYDDSRSSEYWERHAVQPSNE